MTRTRFITQSAAIAAMYAVLTIAFAPISYGQIQFRISEALTVLPFFTPAAIPGLFVGCIIANLVGHGELIDIVFGSLASLISAILSYKMPKHYLAPLPPIVVNGIVVGFVLHYLYQLPLLISMGWVALGQIVVCYGLGYPLIIFLKRYRRYFKI